MAQQAKVPEFGNWDSGENVPYTQFFEKARQGRGTGKLINPNDPEQNPEAFHGDASASDAPVPDSKPKDTIGTTREEDLRPTESPLRHDPASHRNSPLHIYDYRSNTGDQHRKATSRASGGFDNSVEPSPLHPSYQKFVNKAMSSPSNNSSESSYAHSSTTASRLRMKAGGRGDETPERVSAVPKFGEWDESNPSSGDGYTHIFNKVREEKKSGLEKVSMISNDSIYTPGQDSNNTNTGCCCLNFFRK